MDIEKRLARLERQNRILTLLVLVAVAALLVGAAQPPDVVRATRFVLVDEQGRMAGMWGTGGDDVTLAMHSREGGLSKLVLQVDPKPSLMMVAQDASYSEIELDTADLKLLVGSTRQVESTGKRARYELGQPWSGLFLNGLGQLEQRDHEGARTRLK